MAATAGACRDAASNGASSRDLPGSVLHVGDMTNSIRSLMWRGAGIMRNEDSLRNALSRLESWDDYVSQVDFRDARGWELVNLLTVGLLVVEAALWRRESRGTHFRTDFPEKDDGRFRAHSVQRLGHSIHAQPISG
jgi:L-aspartate oxidase